MIRELETVQNKPVELLLTSAQVTKGAPVDIDYEDETVAAATDGLGTKLVDINPVYEGIYSIVEPTDADFETAETGTRVRVIQTLPGEMYATSELTKGSLTEGNPVKVSSGKFVAATEGTDDYAWVYRGEYSDPTGIAMYRISRVEVVRATPGV